MDGYRDGMEFTSREKRRLSRRPKTMNVGVQDMGKGGNEIWRDYPGLREGRTCGSALNWVDWIWLWGVKSDGNVGRRVGLHFCFESQPAAHSKPSSSPPQKKKKSIDTRENPMTDLPLHPLCIHQSGCCFVIDVLDQLRNRLRKTPSEAIIRKRNQFLPNFRGHMPLAITFTSI
uniref:Uncharacterized protein n=1 Tax=Panagrellus redivivus TaxID=6233 RepID=A0A7E4ZRX4_PANRE